MKSILISQDYNLSSTKQINIYKQVVVNLQKKWKWYKTQYMRSIHTNWNDIISLFKKNISII